MASLAHGDLTAPKRVALYARVSTEDQADAGTVKAQRDLLTNLATAYGWDVAGEYVDDGYSGTLALEDRPDGQRLLADARAGRFAEVVAYRLDRLGRSLRVLLDAHAALEAAGVTIKSATEPFDTSTPIGKFLFQLLGSLAELDRSNLLERMTLGRDRVARDGRWTGGAIPFGYALEEMADGASPRTAKGNRSRRLVPSARPVPTLDVTEAELAREIFRRIADGSSATAECVRLNGLGVACERQYSGGPARVAGVAWHRTRLVKMLRNPVYTGRHVLNSRNGPIERAVPALVDSGTQERAVAQLTTNRNMSRKNAKREYLLRGLVVCDHDRGGCGLRYTGTTKPTGHGSTGERAYYYCNASNGRSTHPGHDCRARALRAEALDEAIWADCVDLIRHPGKALAEAQRQLRARLAKVAGLAGERRRLQHLLSEKDAERERVMTLFRRGRRSLEDTETELDDVQREASQIRTALDALRAQEDLAQAAEAQHADAAALLATYRAQLDAMGDADDRAAKRRIIAGLVAGIEVKPDGAGLEDRVRIRYRLTSNWVNRVADALASATLLTDLTLTREPSGRG